MNWRFDIARLKIGQGRLRNHMAAGCTQRITGRGNVFALVTVRTPGGKPIGLRLRIVPYSGGS